MEIDWVKTTTSVFIPNSNNVWTDTLRVGNHGIEAIEQEGTGIGFVCGNISVGIPWSNVRFVVFKEA